MLLTLIRFHMNFLVSFMWDFVLCTSLDKNQSYKMLTVCPFPLTITPRPPPSTPSPTPSFNVLPGNKLHFPLVFQQKTIQLPTRHDRPGQAIGSIDAIDAIASRRRHRRPIHGSQCRCQPQKFQFQIAISNTKSESGCDL